MVMSGGSAGGLGKNRDNCRTKENLSGNQRLAKHELQEVHGLQREITTVKSLGFCGVAPLPEREHVEVVSWEASRASWSGVQRCGSKFCVHCQGKHRHSLIEDLDRGLHAVDQAGGTILVGVFTCSNQGLRLSGQLDHLHKIWRLVLKRRGVERLLESYGYVGSGRGDDVMIHPKTERHHPHIHYALAFNQELSDEEIEELERLLVSYWCETMGKRGVLALEEQQRLERARPREETEGAQYRYMAKGVAMEVSNGLVKVGKNGSVSYFGLLVMIWRAIKAGEAQEEVDRLIRLYQRTEQELSRRRLVHISKSLRERASTLQEPEESEEDEGEERVVLVRVPVVVHKGMRDLGVVAVTPSLCVSNEWFLSKLRKLCEEESRAQEERGYALERATPSLLYELRGLYGELAGLDMMSQLALLGRKPNLRMMIGVAQRRGNC